MKARTGQAFVIVRLASVAGPAWGAVAVECVDPVRARAATIARPALAVVDVYFTLVPDESARTIAGEGEDAKLVTARTSISAWPGGAFVEVVFAVVTLVSVRTDASVCINEVCAVVEHLTKAWRACTLVDIHFAVGALETGITAAAVRVDAKRCIRS